MAKREVQQGTLGRRRLRAETHQCAQTAALMDRFIAVKAEYLR
jgi:hypothetical protein